MKASLALSVRGRIVVSQHLGDLDTPEARDGYARAIADLARLHDAEIRHAATDAHPDYFSTTHPRRLGCPVRAVQHHLAHVAACMAEHGLAPPLLGVAWDGTGHGPDGTIWGGEFLKVSDGDVRRVAHLRAFPLPGGERAVREPRRAALGLLHAAFGRGALALRHLPPLAAFSETEAALLATMCAKGLNAPLTTSAGRLFDAVASLAGLCQTVSYEGEAAIRLEAAIAGGDEAGAYPFAITGEAPLVIDWQPALDAILADLAAGVAAGLVAARFHNGLADAIVALARRIGVPRVALCGGCFQNLSLLERTIDGLRAAGHLPYWPEAVPTNDGGLSVGQVAWAARHLGREEG
jgi:hydrogenase maturation protein HypF